MRKRTEAEQKALRNRVRGELARMEETLANMEALECLDSFKNKFNLCETVYKVVLEQHQLDKGNKVQGHLTVTMTQVPHALKYAGYEYDRNLLEVLFGSAATRGHCSVKKLRDAVTHGLNPSAVEEIQDRREELFGYMDAFLDTIRTFDQAEQLEPHHS